jgi:hypothetical protein
MGDYPPTGTKNCEKELEDTIVAEYLVHDIWSTLEVVSVAVCVDDCWPEAGKFALYHHFAVSD